MEPKRPQPQRASQSIDHHESVQLGQKPNPNKDSLIYCLPQPLPRRNPHPNSRKGNLKNLQLLRSIVVYPISRKRQFLGSHFLGTWTLLLTLGRRFRSLFAALVGSQSALSNSSFPSFDSMVLGLDSQSCQFKY